jgi:hypothetical protein
MSEGSINYEAAFSLDYDPGIFFIPGAGAKISQPNVGSIFALSGALGQATSLLEQAKSAVSSLSGGALSFDANAVADFALNTAVGAAQEALKSAVPGEISSATAFLSQFDPQQLASISSFNSVAASIGSPQDLVSQVAAKGSQALGSLSSAAGAALASVTGGAADAIGGAVTGAVGGVAGGLAGGLAGGIASKAVSSLAGSLGPQAAKLAGGALPDAETWSTVFGPSFDPSLAPVMNLCLAQETPPISQVLETEVAGTLYGAAGKIPGTDFTALVENPLF